MHVICVQSISAMCCEKWKRIFFKKRTIRVLLSEILICSRILKEYRVYMVLMQQCPSQRQRRFLERLVVSKNGFILIRHGN